MRKKFNSKTILGKGKKENLCGHESKLHCRWGGCPCCIRERASGVNIYGLSRRGAQDVHRLNFEIECGGGGYCETLVHAFFLGEKTFGTAGGGGAATSFKGRAFAHLAS